MQSELLLEAQSEVWTAHQLDPRNPQFNCSGYLDLRGTLDVAMFEHALAQANAEAHSLWQRVESDPAGLPRLVTRAVSVLERIDFSEHRDSLGEARSFMEVDTARAVHLGSDPLVRLALVRVGPEHHLFYTRYHHLVCDGFGQMLYWNRIGHIYTALVDGRVPDPSEFGTAAQLFEEDRERASGHSGDLDHWSSELGGVAQQLDLPRDLSVQKGVARRSRTLEPDAVATLAGREGRRWSTVSIALVAAYLRRVVDTDTIVVGFPVRGRLGTAQSKTPTMLSNELPLVLTIGLDATMGEVFDEVESQVEQLLRHQFVRGEHVQRAVRAAHPDAVRPNVVLNVMSFSDRVRMGAIDGVVQQISTGPVRDLSIDLYRLGPHRAELHLATHGGLVDSDGVTRHADRLEFLLARADAVDVDTRVRALAILPPDERTLLDGFNDTETSFPPHSTITAAFVDRVSVDGRRVALTDDVVQLTYKQLGHRVAQVSEALRQCGVGPGTTVAVEVPRSIDMVVAILGVMSCGAAYLPVDPAAPRQRREFIVRDCAASVLVTRDDVTDPSDAATMLSIDTLARKVSHPPLRVEDDATAPAYVIYTSGSTGVPKGVIISHRAIMNRLLWMKERYDVGPDDVFLQKTNATFDVSVWELFLPLITGARLHVPRPGAERDPRVLAATLHEQSVSIAHFIPSMLDAYLSETTHSTPALRHVVCSGEALPVHTVDAFARALPGVRLHNLYGPTEAAVDVTAWEASSRDRYRTVPIGRPIANTKIRVVDEHLLDCPIGVAGELCIGGIQLSDGYVDRPELDTDRFVRGGDLTERFYRSGDIARWLPNGVVEYLGRRDDQVKIRGFRVEIGEIESRLTTLPGVIEVAVMSLDSALGKQLAAFVVAENVSVDDMRQHLAAFLPEYMIPTVWQFVIDIPRLANGKRDGTQLRVLAQAETAPNDVSSQTHSHAETELLSVWRHVLGLPEAGTDANFFAVGGDSMRALRVRSLMESRHGTTFELDDLYRFPTVGQLASQLVTAHPLAPVVEPFELVHQADLRLLPDGLDDAYPLTSMQSGILYQYESNLESSTYRVVTSIAVDSALDVVRLRAACDATAARHPQLRISIDVSTYSEPLQLVHTNVTIPVAEGMDLGALPDDEQIAAVAAFVDEVKTENFDLTTPPLLRFVAHRRNPNRFQLTVIEHHVVLDGWSDVLLLEEVVDRYRGLPVPEGTPTPRYADFVAFDQRQSLRSDAKEFWRDDLRDASIPALFGRSKHSAVAARALTRVPIDVSSATTLAVMNTARALDVSVKSVLVAAHVLAVAVASGADDILTGLIVNGRLEQVGSDEVIGVFLNTLPLRIDLTNMDGSDLVQAVHDRDRMTSRFRHYPFGEIQRDVRDSLSLEDLPSYVNFMDFRRADYRPGRRAVEADIAVADTDYPTAVDFLIEDGTGRIEGWIDGNLVFFDEGELTRFALYHERALKAIVELSATPVLALDLLSPDHDFEPRERWGPRTNVDRGRTITARFLDEARSCPDAPALSHRWTTMSYSQVAGRVAAYQQVLIHNGVERGGRVGIMVERSPELVASILAVMSIGAHYVPLDPSYPSARLSVIIDDAELAALVVGGPLPRELTVPNSVPTIPTGTVTEAPVEQPVVSAIGDDIAYVIYTSGSTGRPKGVRITHANVLNFLDAMSYEIGCARDDVVLAVTSVSFDISILELLWPLTCGAHVVVADDGIARNLSSENLDNEDDSRTEALDTGLFFFAATAPEEEAAGDVYGLLTEAAVFADTHGFSSVWTPERHFNEFGGLYPNPALTSAALATITHDIALRGGSVVAPLHDPLRMAEEWAVVDQLSHGRVGLAFASGWNSNDFALAPSHFATRKAITDKHVDDFLTLWCGGTVPRVGGSGEHIDVRTFPRPVQKLPPIWLTSVGTVETFRKAGARGANVLTHLFGQDIATLTDNIAAYRQARAAAGYEGKGLVSLMMHTFVQSDPDQARRLAREPFKNYLRRSTELWRVMFASTGQEFDDEADDHIDVVLDRAVDRYFDEAGLFGSPESCLPLLRRIRAAGVDEIAALIDFGVEKHDVLDGLRKLNDLRLLHHDEVNLTPHSLGALGRRHGVTMMQGTPSLISEIVRDSDALTSLSTLRALLVGGEQFPVGLAKQLSEALPRTRVFNMYGPTETTIWSTVYELTEPLPESTISIGRPISNTAVRVLNSAQAPVPEGVAGELWIGGEGVGPGYVDRPELTSDRFRWMDGVAFYGTGDRVRWQPDGKLEFRGRIDRQVKIHGQRVEPDEIENILSANPAIAEIAIIAVEAEQGTELAAYFSPSDAGSQETERAVAIGEWSTLWNSAYRDVDKYAGWTSTYTGDQLSRKEMDSWVENTVRRVRSLRPRRVLEIGTGSGLVLEGLLDDLTVYHGVDTAPGALERARARSGHRSDVDITFEVADARSAVASMLDLFDTVVINSVAQYFPDSAYLAEVLDRAVGSVGVGGHVFVGDVRSHDDLELFYLSLERDRLGPLTTLQAVRSSILRRFEDENELCVAPDFFREFGIRHPGIDITFELKSASDTNEMTLFRYDVVLTVTAGSQCVAARPVELTWTDSDAVREHLTRSDDAFVVSRVPNGRLHELVIAEATASGMSESATLWDLEREIWPVLDDNVVPVAEWYEIGARDDRSVRVSPSSNSLTSIDVVFSGKGGRLS